MTRDEQITGPEFQTLIGIHRWRPALFLSPALPRTLFSIQYLVVESDIDSSWGSLIGELLRPQQVSQLLRWYPGL